MEYRIQRGDQTFGPYTEAEVREYLASGNLVEEDLARTEDMKKWRPLRKILPKRKRPKFAMFNPAGLRADLPTPPDIPWVMALVLEMVTGLAFFVGWDIVQAVWLRRVEKSSRAIIYYSITAVLVLLNAQSFYANFRHYSFFAPLAHVTNATYLTVAILVMSVVARFSMRRSLLDHYNLVQPIGLRLSWLWTFLLGGLYFQYKFNQINELKRSLAVVPAQT